MSKPIENKLMSAIKSRSSETKPFLSGSMVDIFETSVENKSLGSMK